MKKLQRILACLIVLAAVCALCLIPAPAPVQAAPALPADIQDGVTLHCWNWSFKNIEKNMEKIAQLGYTAVQVSPIQQAKQRTAGSQTYDWWVFYQPASFSIDDSGNSALGNKAEFKSMCAAAEKYGIKVIVDVVANHMGNDNSGRGISPAIIPDLRDDPACWHDVDTDISNYSDRYNITQYCMDGLPDLDTSNKKVQNYVLNFLKECVDAGADGFRFDAAKHIETPDDTWCASDFWPTVVDGIRAYAPEVYIYGEMLYTTDDGGQLTMGAYTKYMSVTDNTYSNYVRESVVGGRNAGAFSYAYHKDASADKIVLWAESHDTYADGSRYMSTADINKTWALMAARADAMALYLARPDSYTQALGTASSGTGWANVEVGAVNQFHNAFVGQGEYVSSQDGIAYVERGDSGVVLVNCSGDAATVSVAAHTMKDGIYTDTVTGNTFTVSAGQISGKIGDTGIAVVYNANACDHSSHGQNGDCAACGIRIGHSFAADGTCVCGAAMKKIYFVNAKKWTRVNIYSWYDNGDEITARWPGNAMTHVEGDVYCFLLPPDAVNVIFDDGDAQTEDLLIPDGMDLYDIGTRKWSVYESSTPPQPPLPTDPGPTQPPQPSEPVDPTGPEGTEPPATDPSQPSEPTEPAGPDVTEPTQPSEPSDPTQPTQPGKASAEQDEGGKDSTWIVFVAAGAAIVLIAAVLAVILKRKK